MRAGAPSVTCDFVKWGEHASKPSGQLLIVDQCCSEAPRLFENFTLKAEIVVSQSVSK